MTHVSLFQTLFLRTLCELRIMYAMCLQQADKEVAFSKLEAARPELEKAEAALQVLFTFSIYLSVCFVRATSSIPAVS